MKIKAGNGINWKAFLSLVVSTNFAIGLIGQGTGRNAFLERLTKRGDTVALSDRLGKRGA
jgi:hypothetical protein